MRFGPLMCAVVVCGLKKQEGLFLKCVFFFFPCFSQRRGLCWCQARWQTTMALSDTSGDPLALGCRNQHPLLAKGNAPSGTSTAVGSSRDPLTAASSPDNHPAEGGEDPTVLAEAQTLQQRSHAVQRADRPCQNGGVLKQNGTPRSILPSPSSFPAPDPKRGVGHHYSSPTCSPPLQPVPCQHCHLHSALCCPCGQQDCPIFKSQGTGSGSSSGPSPGSHPGTASCCLSACTYCHLHPHHPSPQLSLHHHQRWQEHLQSQTQAPGIR